MSKQRYFLSGLALMVLMSACTSKTASTPPTTSVAGVPSPQSETQSSNSPSSTATTSFPSPTTSSGSSKLLPVPQLIPPTSSLERMPQIAVGRPDPFAALAVPATVSYRAATPSAPQTTANTPALPPAAPSVATVPVPALPPLPTLQPATTNVNQLPSVTIPDRLATPQSMAQAIEISGVVEVGGKTNIIVQVPDEHTSRYVEVGDYLANGKVLVKRVEMGAEPVVVLEETEPK
ncbi:MAG TPA: hypothetical protein V6C65_39115 [Allocoleopsis sp.]